MSYRTLSQLRNLLLICLFAVSCLAQNADRVIFLVRHAEKASQGKDAFSAMKGTNERSAWLISILVFPRSVNPLKERLLPLREFAVN